ncbi:MAG TPA: hypothetical protein DDZ80_16030 [Cyanobacteria bacterium UBA8803]|nr:hypothetical protein [Cyanobacteria bacterium UBA9273]HBL59924.1 hypothetical protein [Cyanobacteria bacterium UBA8803]
MKPKFSILIILTLMMAMLDGGMAKVQPKPLAQMIEVKGMVQLKREGSSNWSQTQKGEVLFLGDLLRVQRGSKGVIRCTLDLTQWTVPDDGLPRGVANTCSPPE